jgi:hypothetical protein
MTIGSAGEECDEIFFNAMDNTIREYISYDMSNEIFKDSK